MDTLNDPFLSVFSEENMHVIPKLPPILHNVTPLGVYDFNEGELIKTDKIKTNKTPGPDCIAPRNLKDKKMSNL